MKHRITIWLFVAVVVLVPMTVYGIVKLLENHYQSLPVLIGNDHRVGSFRMTNQAGQPVSEAAYDGRITVTDFFFTRCPVICPKMTRSLKQVQEAFGDKIRIRSFTVDPGRDTPAVLAAYRKRFAISGASWQLLTGDKKEIYKLARNSFRVVATDGDGGPQDFIHSDRLVLTDRRQRIRGYYDGTDPQAVNQLINDIKKLTDEN
ncbi:MAG TPA: SCO family protein [Chitinophagaceae bacterium]|jgi:protein SCO1/2|nr:SCO family protein [Chitinophagaceae bacterium]